jgi:hypothetical protein
MHWRRGTRDRARVCDGDEEGLFEPRKEAKRVAALFTVSFGPETAYVLDPVDDVTFTHEAAFAKGANGKWRKAYVGL